MKERANARVKQLKLKDKLVLDFVADMRFVGQAFEVPVEFTEKELAKITTKRIAQRFGEEHHKVYFFGGDSDKPVEFVSFRLGFRVPLKDLPLLSEEKSAARETKSISMFDERRWQDGKLMSRASLKPGKSTPGPALLEDPTSTLILPSGWSAMRDENDNTILKRKS